MAALYLVVDHNGYSRAQSKYKLELQAVNSSYEIAIAKTKADQISYNRTIEDGYDKKAKDSDIAYINLRTKYDANLLRYSQDQVRQRASAGSTKVGLAEGNNGPSSRPDLHATEVSISYTDAKICVDNTARLQVAHSWGQSILADQLKPFKPSPIVIPTNSGE